METYIRPEVLGLDRSIHDKYGNRHDVEAYLDPTRLPDEEQARLVEELTPVTGRGFLRQNVHAPELYEDVANHVIDCDRLVVTRLGGEVTCFMAASSVDTPEGKIFHLGGIIVEPEFHHSGIAYKLLKRETRGSDFLAFHTQSMKMLMLGAKIANINSEDSIRFADAIGTRNRVGVVDVGRYGGSSLYGDEEAFESCAIVDLNWKQGDAMICVGPIVK